jgi:hypothetical protein
MSWRIPGAYDLREHKSVTGRPKSSTKVASKTTRGQRRNPNRALELAHRAESQALAEYARVLRRFTDFTVNGKLPEELVAGSQGV